MIERNELPGGRWLSGPGVAPGELGLTPVTVTVVRVRLRDEDADGTLRHLSFDDPPEGMPAERYEAMIRGNAKDAPTLAIFTHAMLHGLGGDLVGTHGCEPDEVEKAVTEFALRIWAEEHPA